MQGKKTTLRLVSFGFWIALVGLSNGTLATQASSVAQQPDPQADNTKMNKQDNSKGAVTADQQKDNPADREIARKIRRAIVQDKSLSTYAHNVKVIVRGGLVTLKGPVRNEDEKSNVAAKAAEIAGADKVQNELTIKS